MRNMSFALTTEAVRDHSKTVTRRLGWRDLKPGTILQAVEKAQGLRKGEHVKPICLIRVVSVADGPLWRIAHFGVLETTREGFPDMTAAEFIVMFCRANGCDPDTIVNRIEFAYVGDDDHDELQIDTTGMLPCPLGCGWKVTAGTPCPEHPNVIVGGIIQ